MKILAHPCSVAPSSTRAIDQAVNEQELSEQLIKHSEDQTASEQELSEQHRNRTTCLINK
jgi:hypothetical protein